MSSQNESDRSEQVSIDFKRTLLFKGERGP